MEQNSTFLPPTIKTNFKVKALNGSEEAYRRKQNPRKGVKELHENSASQEKYHFEPKSSIELKISTKSLLPTLKQDKSAVFRRHRESKREMTLDKILGSDFKPIELSQIEDFSRELFPPRPVINNLTRQRRESFYSQDSEKENKRADENYFPQSLNDEELDSGSYSEDLHYRRVLNKPGKKLYFNTNKLSRENSLEGSSPQNLLHCQSSTLPALNSEYRGYNEYTAHPLKKSQFSRRIEEIEDYSLSANPLANNNRQGTPAVLIMENHEDLYNYENSPGKPEKEEPINKVSTQIDTATQHNRNQSQTAGPDKTSPAPSYKGLKPLRLGKVLKENKAPTELNINESAGALKNEDQVLLQKYGSKFGIKPQELYKKRNRSPLNSLLNVQLTANTPTGRNLRDPMPLNDDKKQSQSSTLKSKTRLFYQ